MKNIAMNSTKVTIFRLFCILMLGLLLFHQGTIYAQDAQGITQQDIKAVNEETVDFDPTEPCTNSNSLSLSGPNSATGTSGGNYPVKVPLIKNPKKLADAIDSYIKSTAPTSPMNGLGKYFIQGGMRAGINPLLAVAQSQKESGFGTAGISLNGSKNAMGRRATSRQPNVNLWYKYDSWEASLYAAAYPASGGIDQPDDWFQYVSRVYAAQLTNLHDFAYKYAPPSENKTEQYIKDVTTYSNNVIKLAPDSIDMTQLGSSGDSGATTAPVPVNTATKTVVALDPGHGGEISQYIDQKTGLPDRETANTPEREDVLDVAKRVKTKLESSGYSVVLLRTTADEKVSKRERVDKALAAGAKIAISIHTTPGPYTDSVWYQRVGYGREYQGKKVEFKNQATADLSKKYATAIAGARKETQKRQTTIDEDGKQEEASLNRPDLPGKGNLTLVQLWSDSVPWVYNESAVSGKMSDQDKQAYADGISSGVINSVPTDNVSPTNPACGATAGSVTGSGLANTVLNYAWPEYHTPPYVEKKPAYEDAVSRAQAEGRYVGGTTYPGVDCGGFVTTLMIDSGFEPNYNYSGLLKNGASSVAGGQTPWLLKNWQSLGHIKDTAQLKPGDVAIKNDRTHTYVFVGNISGFQSQIASASFAPKSGRHRAPMAGKEATVTSEFEWFRKR
jgi:N-acetylmuramoyl-L-alanine amidase